LTLFFIPYLGAHLDILIRRIPINRIWILKNGFGDGFATEIILSIYIPTHRSLLAPLYRWPGLRILVGFDTYSLPTAVYIEVFLFEYTILRLLSWTIIFVDLNPIIHQRYQYHKPWQAYRYIVKNRETKPLWSTDGWVLLL
jgi:hypothetical protein